MTIAQSSTGTSTPATNRRPRVLFPAAEFDDRDGATAGRPVVKSVCDARPDGMAAPNRLNSAGLVDGTMSCVCVGRGGGEVENEKVCVL